MSNSQRSSETSPVRQTTAVCERRLECRRRFGPQMGICPLVFACDEAYAMPLATTLRSVVESNRGSWPLEVYVLSDGFGENTRRKIVESLPDGSVSIHWVQVDLSPFGKFSTMPYISKMTYARFLIPSLLGNDISKVLYLDADLLVLDDLGSLWNVDLEGAVLGAVLDRLDSRLKSRELKLKEVPHVRDYFNVGVLLIDLNRWRKERISEKALQYLTQHPCSPYSDQDALNVACDCLWKKLDPRWNFQDHDKNGISDLRMDQRPGIIHFVTSLKPWDARSLNLDAGLHDSFRGRTRFARTKSEKLFDTVKNLWSRSKSGLRRYPFLKLIWNHVGPRSSHIGA